MGYLLSLSGLDGSGKSTQANSIYKVCIERGLKVETIHLKTVDPKQYIPMVKKNCGPLLLRGI